MYNTLTVFYIVNTRYKLKLNTKVKSLTDGGEWQFLSPK